MIRIVCDGSEHKFRALPVTIGRDPDNDLPLEDNRLSRHHCRIIRTPEGIVVEDLESRNGTFVNGVPTRRHLLSAGDTVMIGGTPLSVEWESGLVPEPKRKKPPAPPGASEREGPRLRELLELIKALARERNEETLLRRILDGAIGLMGAERGFLFLVTLQGLDFRAARDGNGNDVERPAEMISRSIARQALESGRPVITDDAEGDSRFAGWSSIAFLKLRSVVCVPLKVPDGPIGALYLEDRRTMSHFESKDLPLATALADLSAIALSAARTSATLRTRDEQLRLARDRVARLSERLRSLLGKPLRRPTGRGEDTAQAEALRHDFRGIIGRSAALQGALTLVDRLVESDLPVLLVGESGTGKELAARTLHANGSRRAGRFVCVPCAAIPTELVETELFGHEAGAYTGASKAREGLFEQADGGTLFLDDVGDLPLEAQGKLLRALENGEVRRVGGSEVRHVSVRTVAATRKDLLALTKEGGFREDLYYRLAGAVVPLPPLRERPEDTPLLFEHFLDGFVAEQGLTRPSVSPEVLDRMQAYPWPGNVRELRNEVQRLLLLRRGTITPDLLSFQVYSGDPGATSPAALPPGGLKEMVESMERRMIVDTLRRLKGNKTRTAALLGLSRLGLRKKIERYGLKEPE